MKPAKAKLLNLLAVTAIFLAACGSSATPDASAIATSAVQTVEARYTEQAAQQPTQSPSATPTPEPPTSTPPAPETQPTQKPIDTPKPSTGGTPCLSANFVADVTVADYSIIAPGAKFTKTWRVKNTGSCPWDSGYKLTLDSGNAMGSVTSFPLPSVVYQDQTVDISIDLTAPATEGIYKGYWRLATPFGGTIGFGDYDAALSVIITSATNSKKEFSVVSVTYDPIVRSPKTGCPKETTYTLTAHITVNSAGAVDLHFERNPYDGSKYEIYTLNFKEAGTKSASWTWTLHPDQMQGERWMAVYIDSPNQAMFDRVYFSYTCE